MDNPVFQSIQFDRKKTGKVNKDSGIRKSMQHIPERKAIKLVLLFSFNSIYKRPSELLTRQKKGNILEDIHKPKITKFLNIADFSIYKDSIVPIDKPIFEPRPSLIQFNDYEPLQIKEKIFKLRNRDNVGRVVKIIQPDSRLFQIIPATSLKLGHKQEKSQRKKKKKFRISAGSKVAPGMAIYYVIRFSPEAKIDYKYNLTIVTEREQFIVPIVAVGKRSMIDFPDVIDFGHCPVKYCT